MIAMMTAPKTHFRAMFATTLLLVLTGCQPDAADRLERAQSHMASGDYQAAVLEARGALQDEPANVEARVLFAAASRQLGDYRTAVAEYGRALELGADDPQTLRDYAEVLLVAGQAEEVIQRLAPALETEPRNARALTLLANAYEASGDPERAGALYKEALVIDRATVEAHIGLARIARAAGDLESMARILAAADTAVGGHPMISLFRAADATEPQRRHELVDEAYAGLDDAIRPSLRAQVIGAKLESHLRRNEIDAAQAMADEYKRLAPGAPQSIFFQSLIDFERGELDKAKEGFMRLSAASEAGSPADVFLGSINLRQSNLNQAEAYLNNALRYDADSVEARKLLAETLLQLGRADSALEILASLGSASDDDPSVLAMLGRAAVASGNADRGVEYFERSVAADPGNPSLLLATAYSHLAAGDSEAALGLLESMPAQGEASYRPAILRMLAHMTTADRESAVAEADRLVADNPGDAAALSIAGQLMISLSDADKAIEYYKQALEIDARDITARYGLGQALRTKGDLQGALREFTAVLDRQPGYVPAVSAFGAVAIELDREADAVRRIEAAIAAAPDSPLPRLLLAQFYLAKGELDLALMAADAGLEVTPDNAKLLQQRARARLRLGQVEAARQDFALAAELSPRDRQMQLDLARIQLAAGEMSAATRTVGRYLEQRPNDVTAQLFAADLDVRNNQVARAEAVLDRILAADPDNRAALIVKGDAAVQREALDEALGLFARAAALERDRMVTLRLYATRRRNGDADAVDELKRWLDANPGDIAMESIIAQSLDEAGDRAAAIASYEEMLGRGITNDAQRAIVLNNLAWMYHTQGDPRAMGLAEQARQLRPDSGAILDTYAWILFESGEQRDALPLLRRANELDPTNADIRYHLAAAMAANGEKERAIRLLEQTLAQSPQFSEREGAEALLRELR